MFIVVTRESAEPVYEQIARQVRAAIAGGDLAAGSTLPPVRVLASDLGVNLNTVARAYRLLEDEGFVDIEDRAGARVAPPARRPDRATRDELLTALADCVARMRQAGFSTAEIERAVNQALSGGRSPEELR